MLREVAETLDEGDDLKTRNGITQIDPKSTWPARYIEAYAGDEGPIPLTEGTEKIQWTGVESENHWKESDQWSLTNRQRTYIYLALQTVRHFFVFAATP
jgi:hypothetical protein